MHIRDRIQELRRVLARELRPNPRNWRTHPEAQRNALQGLLAEIGYAHALLARELSDGSLELIDGHLRAETTPDALVPVLVLDVDEAEANKLLATLDPMSRMAGTDDESLYSLLDEVTTQNVAVQSLLEALRAGDTDEPARLPPHAPPEERQVTECYQILVECAGEREQQSLYERLTAEGFSCRVLTL